MKSLNVCAILFGMLLGSAHAAGESAALKNNLVIKFKADDVVLMRVTVQKALNAEADGAALNWKNELSKASGSATPLARFTWNGLPCRRVRIFNRLDEAESEGVYRFCEKPPGRWKLVGPDRKSS